MSKEELLSIVSQFEIAGTIADVRNWGAGFINDTFLVRTYGAQFDYILQRKNRHVFPDIPAMMQNIVDITAHIKTKVDDPLRETLTVVPTKDRKYFYFDGEHYWTMVVYIENSITYDSVDSSSIAYCGGVGIGRFQNLLADFDKQLHETIPGFHNICFRFGQWEEALSADRVGRVRHLKREIDAVEVRREEILRFWQKIESGEIPKRVAHNDTKISNILFDKHTKNPLCVIDLDTVMTSTSLYDFGDAIRSYTNTGKEDDNNLDNVSMDLERFRAFAEGYLSEQKSLNSIELQWLAFSARYITYEQALRFLMDYINGDTYYKIAFPEHNLIRTCAQLHLLESMEEQYDAMCAIILELS